MNDVSNKTPDMFYVKAEHKEAFLKTVIANIYHAGTAKGFKYPIFLNIGSGRKCDYSGDFLLPNDDIYCVYVMNLNPTLFDRITHYYEIFISRIQQIWDKLRITKHERGSGQSG